MQIIKSKILRDFPELIHGISTKPGGSPPFCNNLSRHVGDDENNVRRNRDKFFGSLGIDQAQLVHANQIHSDNISIVAGPGLYKETDGLITSEKNLFLIISVADCLPVIVYDSKKHIIANIHAGWRGTQKKIVKHAVEIFTDRLGSDPADLKVFLGPCISGKNFEVGRDVAELFEPLFIENRRGKYYADLLNNNLNQLASMGVKHDNTEVCGLCTYENQTLLHSYRRDRERSGRMFAVIGMKQ